MRKALCALLLLMAASTFTFAIDVSTASGATLSIISRTSLGIDLDNPYKYGLKQEFPEFALYYNMAPNQEITNKVKSDKPQGFIDLHMDVQSMRFSNGANPDDNTPAGNGVGLDFNDSAQQTTGYFGPFYIYGFQAGIAYHNYILQLAAGGDDCYWKPWNRTLEFLNDRLGASWAYMDTRVQYRRDVVATLPVDINTQSEAYYWTYQGDNAKRPNPYTSPFDTDLDSLYSTIPSGTMIGLQHAGEEFSYMVKAATEYAYDSTFITRDDANGLAAGLDYAITPAALKGFRVLGSFTGTYNYGVDSDPDPVFGGAKFSYDIPVPGQKGVSVEPYVGYDGRANIASDASVKYAQELAGGATLHWPGKSGWLFDNFQNRSGVVYPGLTAAYKLYLPDDGSAYKHNILVTLMEDEGDGGALYGVGAEAVLQFFDFTNKDNGKLLASLYCDYAIKHVYDGQLIPWIKAFYDFYPVDSSSALKLDIGVKLKDAIQNAVLGLTWDSGVLVGQVPAGTPMWGDLKTYVEISI
jgi:hypothetical protein